MPSPITLVTIDIGYPLRVATRNVSIPNQATGEVYRFVGKLTDVSLPVDGDDNATGEITLPVSILDPQALRRAGLLMAGAKVEMSLYRPGDDWSLRSVRMNGRIIPNSERRYIDRTTWSIGAIEDQQFPPHIMQISAPNAEGVIVSGFPALNPSDVGKCMPVIYGNCRDVALIPLQYDIGPQTAQVDFLICGHRIASTTVTVRPNGQINAAIPGVPVKYTIDAVSGATYAYVTLTQQQMLGYSSFVCDVRGHVGDGGTVISGLGDVIEHALLNYSGLTEDRIDRDRLSRFKVYANRINIACVFGGSPGQNLIQTLQGRFQQNFPVAINFRGGRVGATWLGWDEHADPMRTLEWQRDIIDVIDPVIETQPDQMLYSDFTLEYDRDILASDIGHMRLRQTVRVGIENEKCARAFGRMGRRNLYQVVQLADVNDGQSARCVIDYLVDQHAVVRTQVDVLATFDVFASLPILEYYALNVSRLGWVARVFRLMRVAPTPDGFVKATFLSREESP